MPACLLRCPEHLKMPWPLVFQPQTVGVLAFPQPGPVGQYPFHSAGVSPSVPVLPGLVFPSFSFLSSWPNRLSSAYSAIPSSGSPLLYSICTSSNFSCIAAVSMALLFESISECRNCGQYVLSHVSLPCLVVN